LCSFFAKAQLNQAAQIDTMATAIYADNLDNIYLITPKEELLKYDAKGQLKWRYSNNRFGKLKSVDVADPLRILLFYADFQQVIVLNNNLNEVTSYSFAQNSNQLITAIAAAANGFWAFERTQNQLLKLSHNFIEDMRSANLSQILDTIIEPKRLVATDQFIYLQQKNNEILQFDRFGSFIKYLPINLPADFNITAQKIVFGAPNEVIYYNPLNGETVKEAFVFKYPVKQIAVGNKIIAALTEKAVFLLSK
jgi:hypothetical protein